MTAATKTKKPQQASLLDIRSRVLAAEVELGGAVLEREAVIRSLWHALLSREHILLLGPPGTGKSMLTILVQSVIDGAELFDFQLGKTSLPTDLFGTINPALLAQGRMERIVMGGTMATAHIAYLDEIFKANSTTLNALLGVLNERTFRNGSAGVQSCPLITSVGCSNEYPQSDELGALYDRFLVRHWVGYLREEDNWLDLVLGGRRGKPTSRITLAELARAQADVETVTIPRSLSGILLSIRSQLASSGINASDRRWFKAMRIVRAQAWIEGRAEATKSDLLCLSSVLWDNYEEEGRKVSEVLLTVCAPKLKELLGVMDLAHEQVRIMRELGRDDTATRGQIKEAKEKFSELQISAEALIPDAGPKGAAEAKRLANLAVEAAKLHGAASW